MEVDVRHEVGKTPAGDKTGVVELETCIQVLGGTVNCCHRFCVDEGAGGASSPIRISRLS